MAGRVIFFVEDISDQEQLNKYKKAAHPTLAPAGGKVSVAYGKHEVVEGAALKGVVMIDFPTYEEAAAWYHSDSYGHVKTLREGAARTHAVIVETL